MNATDLEIVRGKWPQVQQRMRQHWSKLTEDDLARIGADLEGAPTVIEARYHRSRAIAEREWARFCDTCCVEERRRAAWARADQNPPSSQ